jgi:hypothetical protein
LRLLSIVLLLGLVVVVAPPPSAAAAACVWVRVVEVEEGGEDRGRIHWRVAEEEEEEEEEEKKGRYWKPRAIPASCRSAAPPISVLLLGWVVGTYVSEHRRRGGGVNGFSHV